MFIADELNLTSISNKNALAPSLEINLNHSIYFPWNRKSYRNSSKILFCCLPK